MENPSAFPMGEPNDGFAQYFVGQSYLAPVLETPQIAIHNVTFRAGLPQQLAHPSQRGAGTHRGRRLRLLPDRGTGAKGAQGRAGRLHPRGYEALAWRRPGESCSHLAFMVPSEASGIHEQRMARAGGCRSLRQTCLRSVVLIWRAILQKWDGPFCCSGR